MAFDLERIIRTVFPYWGKFGKYAFIFLAVLAAKYFVRKMTGMFRKDQKAKKAKQELAKAELKAKAQENTPIADMDTDNVVQNFYYDTYINKVTEYEHIPFKLPRYSANEMEGRVKKFYNDVNTRRTVRTFSSDAVPENVIEECIRAAGTAPSGAHTQPWHYVCIYNQEDKLAVREIVEEEEKVNYEKRMGKDWLNDLAKVGTTWEKEYISNAPCIVLVFKAPYDIKEDNTKSNNWYFEASVSISVGIFLCALTNAGLVTVTSTPMNCGPALRRLVGRPDHEKLAYLLPIGFPSEEATVPNLVRKDLDKIMTAIH